jgi:hypothetical protein
MSLRAQKSLLADGRWLPADGLNDRRRFPKVSLNSPDFFLPMVYRFPIPSTFIAMSDILFINRKGRKGRYSVAIVA